MKIAISNYSFAAFGLLVLTACAGTAPDAVEKGYPRATINNTAGLDCSAEIYNSRKDIRRTGGTPIIPCNPFDGGFEEAVRHEAGEARREARRNGN